MINRSLLISIPAVLISMLFTGTCFGEEGTYPFRIVTEEFLPYNYTSDDGRVAGISTGILMKKVSTLIIFSLFFVSGGLPLASEKAPKKVVDIAHTELAPLGADPVIVAAVKAENAKKKTLEQIKKLDQKWRSHAGERRRYSNRRHYIRHRCGPVRTT